MAERGHPPAEFSRIVPLDRLDEGVSEREIAANEAELDNAAILPERVTALNNSVQGLSNWRTAADSRLASLEDNQRFNSDLVARVDRVEEVSAENSSSRRGLNTSVAAINRGRTGTGRVITPPILGGGGTVIR